MISLASSILAIVMLLAKAWIDNKPQRAIVSRAQQLQTGRKDLGTQNMDSIATRVTAIRDRLHETNFNHIPPR